MTVSRVDHDDRRKMPRLCLHDWEALLMLVTGGRLGRARVAVLSVITKEATEVRAMLGETAKRAHHVADHSCPAEMGRVMALAA